MIKQRICILILSDLASAHISDVVASDDIYVGGYVSHQNIDVLNRDFNLAGLVAGYSVHDFLSVETRVGKGISEYNTSYNSDAGYNSYQEELGWQASDNLKFDYRIYGSLSAYGLLGYSTANLMLRA
ncbi:hypothetical protein [Salinimonas chungwhensis]|uniref:hypothetical protein n=1 Tax=Salinimonas chungwhensis TaxID=265425 RepID=UPI000372D8E2|nr:hypothetical protein [Salinimonas chungwhensis]